IKKVLKVEIQPFEPLHGDEPIPRELKAIVLKAVGRKPEQRYASVAEMAADIRRWQQGLAVAASPDTPLQQAGRWISNHRQATLAVAFGVLLLVLGAITVSVYSQQAALARQRAYTAYVNSLFELTAQQSQRIDSHFLSMQGLLNYTAASALEYLEQGPASNEPHFPQHPYTAPGQIQSKVFGSKISLDWPTSGFSPGKSIADMQGKLQRLLPIRKVFKDVLLRSYTDHPEALSPEQAQSLIAEQGTPIMWVHVSIQEGVIYMFPGIHFNTPGYDARTRPWYRGTIGTYGARWGSPYFDPLAGALLPCTMALYDPDGHFIGVAGIDLRFQYLIDHLLAIKRPEVRRSYLLNAKGEIVIKSVDTHKENTGSLTKGYETPPYPDATLQAAIKAQKSGGYIEESHQLLLYSRLNTLGWYFVVESAPGEQQD
ncbi:MAG TPA: cache domain-containing protein, partial [Candidatus Obscuribacterales bacterium]